MLETIFQQGNDYCVYTENLPKPFSAEMLTPDYWQNNNAITGSAEGRGTTYFIQYQQHHWVLRHYYRGGLIGKFNKDSYWFSDIEHTRAAKEFSLLKKMQTLGLSAPKAIAYRVNKKGLFYKADLLSSRIENAKDLVDILQSKPLDETVWFNIGVMIHEFHQQGIYHHDLNSHNILLDNTMKPWLIDFDRGEQRKIQTDWQEANIARLLRSFRKEKDKLASFYWDDENWQQLLSGYKKGYAAAKAAS